MKLRAEQLGRQLEGELAPVYLISGDEPLLVQEAADAVRAAARARGHDDHRVMHAERGFDWGTLVEARDSLSLFGGARLLELRLPGGKPGDAGSRALCDYLAAPPPDAVLLILAPRLEAASLRTRWAKAVEQAGVLVQIWPVEAAAMPRWVARRMRAAGLGPAPGAAELIAERTEGNLLAASQEIRKLALMCPGGRVGCDEVAAAVADSARFDVFGLVDAALEGDARRALRVLYGLRAEGVEPTLVLWALAREVRGLTALASRVEGGEQADAALRAQGVRDRRRPLLRRALRRRAGEWRRLLGECARADRVLKGAAAGKPWDELIQLVLDMAGAPAPVQPGTRTVRNRT